jgi:serine/threonine protein kinase
MAPERLRGTTFDRRSDLFGAGVLLWEMLAMRRLFSGADGRSKRAMAATPPPSRFRQGLSPRLDEVIMHALRAEPEDRPRDALGLERRGGRVVGPHCRRPPA